MQRAARLRGLPPQVRDEVLDLLEQARRGDPIQRFDTAADALLDAQLRHRPSKFHQFLRLSASNQATRRVRNCSISYAQLYALALYVYSRQPPKYANRFEANAAYGGTHHHGAIRRVPSHPQRRRPVDIGAAARIARARHLMRR